MYLEDSPGSFLQLVVVFGVKRQRHCLTTAVVVRDGLLQVDPQDGLQSHASWEGPVLYAPGSIRTDARQY